MQTLLKIAGLAVALGALAMPASAPLAQEKAPAKKAAPAKKVAGNTGCAPKRGRGWAPTEGMARFQAWEIVAQTTGNWPIMSDTFKNERYKCQPEGSQWRCDSWIDVCKKG